MKTNCRPCVIWLHLLFACPAAGAVELYVAPNGDDTAAGTRQQPLASLSAARDAVRRLKEQHPDENITVCLRGGVYRLPDTVVFSLGDSGSDNQRITYAACAGETPVLSGGVPVPEWNRLQDAPENLPPTARGKVWVADVSFVQKRKAAQARPATVAEQQDRGARFFTLYAGDRQLPRARGPGFSPTRSTPRNSPDRQTSYFPAGAIRNWSGLRDAELAIIPMHFWVSNLLPLASVDEAAGIATTTFPGTYPLGRNAMQDRDTAWVENVLEVLDEPGEWVLDSVRSKLYFFPTDEGPPADVVVPILTELVRIDGHIDYEGPQDKPVRNLTFRGLTLTHADRFPWHGRSGWGLQHDWERFDSPTATLRLRGAQECAIEECHFVNAGSSGVRLDLHAQGNRIVGNHLEQLGGAGILLSGYGPGTKDANRGNDISNNYVHHIGRLYWGSPAIFAWQSGENRIAHNCIHHTPYTGICVTGRIAWDPRGEGECSRTVRWNEVGVDPAGGVPSLPWRQRERFLHSRRNVVERNDIHHVMEVMGDGNCIYVSGAGGGNLVRENYCHDCDGRYMNAVIRCDDDQHETRIERNLVHRCRGHGEGIISKGDNDIVGNIIADLRPHDRHRGYLVFPYGSPAGSVIQRNIIYACQDGLTICYEGAARGSDAPPRLRDTHADHNVYYSTADPQWGQRHLTQQRAFGIEQHSIVADPRFADVENADFTLLPDSPALKLGIEQPISTEDTGPQAPYRERWTFLVDDGQPRRED